MKTLFGLFLLLSVSAFSSPLDSMVTQEQRASFYEALETFGLLPGQLESSQGRRLQRTGRRPSPDIQTIISGLNQDLENQYFQAAQAQLGECPEENCLSKTEYGASLFIDNTGQKHCYPGTNCEYYRCMEEKYRCLDVGVEYFANLAKPTCEAYVSNLAKDKFGPKGKEWIYTVMVCLQKGLFEECSLRGNCPESESNQKTCEHITEFTLKFHPGCYINSGVGVCKLPIKDQMNIWRTVGPFLTDRERIEAYKVVRYCLFKTPIV